MNPDAEELQMAVVGMDNKEHCIDWLGVVAVGTPLNWEEEAYKELGTDRMEEGMGTDRTGMGNVIHNSPFLVAEINSQQSQIYQSPKSYPPLESNNTVTGLGQSRPLE